MSENNSDHIKMFKNGNSFAFRVSKKDREALNATSETSFEKIVSPDGREITFRKVADEQTDLLAMADHILDQHGDLLKRLEDL
ncbi:MULTISPECIES: AbrB family transcriptional regulator [Lactiplantibacillus]|jgi:antitoxin component of MazEF toxin-antitoxin module|uniref:AbrB family transcriptional regulator n=2 Tax=Lactiplantibacillus pentosus TaxID=1589 RepID=A0AAP9AQM3_LACPE|nr:MULTISPECIES: AbrB family transcriptional regulator [Lactiplantibacillus]AUI80016.1 AbrB family transcriptional regulator [Lactiplantibacillus pentosus]AYJ43267.1 AbrB family transcriptional regulator [Lactiplantibacillus pentosus]MBO9165104.1 AbrB family transcriptional regulator [Lactiplantibacillus pentosus]MBU7449143.1 AbrB family transcriptional regulator [Lactiplantibacillus sp. 7.2.4]MBU7460351.1 AbrB family transcriptional regulator [Lactiplantibacillus pentosus]